LSVSRRFLIWSVVSAAAESVLGGVVGVTWDVLAVAGVGVGEADVAAALGLAADEAADVAAAGDEVVPEVLQPVAVSTAAVSVTMATLLDAERMMVTPSATIRHSAPSKNRKRQSAGGLVVAP
jgi:hypothetical protein